ncbi:hypothetical protein PACTADRAFT_50214, partial [Pachysolen tannophilus NRRL Y-2460]
MTSYNSSSTLRRRRDSKRGIKFTIMICGESGTGKTTFVNSLLDKNILPHKFAPFHEQLSSLPKTLTFTNINGNITDAANFERSFQPQLVNNEPGIAITESKVEFIDDDDSKLLLSIIDTPGFGDNLDNDICFAEIMSYLEQQYDSVLAEETRVRRNPRFEDTRVHVLLYFITPTGHGLRELDVLTMKKLSKYCNIIPVIGRADSFTSIELANFKKNIMFDIDKFNIPIFQFSYDEDEDDLETIEEVKFLSTLVPFAIITSEEKYEINGELVRARKYPWGMININDTTVSDFVYLKNVILGSHLQELKDLTHDFLYESYRTEKLSLVTGFSPQLDNSNGDNRSSREPPSLSNLAEIAGVTNPNSTFNDASSFKSSTSTVRTTRTFKSKNYEGENETTDNDKETIASSSNGKEGVTKSVHSSATSTPRVNSSSASFISSPSSQDSSYQQQLRKLSETVPYALKHNKILERKKKLENLEANSAAELAKKAAELEKKAALLKQREREYKARLRVSS